MAEVKLLWVADIDAGDNVRAPKRHSSPVDVGLRQSIRELGVLQPITVTRNGKRFTCLYGHRRLEQAKLAGLTAIPAIIEPSPDDKPIRQLVENSHRLSVNPIDIALTLRAYLAEHPEVKQLDLAAKLGRTSSWITGKLALLDLPADVQAQVAAGRLAASAAYHVAKASTPAKPTGRPRTLDVEEGGKVATVRVDLPTGNGTPAGKATISVEHGTGVVDLVLEDFAGRGALVTLSRDAARLFGRRLIQASEALAAAAAPAEAEKAA